MGTKSAISATLAVLVVIILIVAAGGAYLALNSQNSSQTTSTYSSNSISSLASSSTTTTTTRSTSTTSSTSSSSTTFSCPNNSTLGNITNFTQISNGTGSFTYNPVDLFENFSSMSVRLSEIANGTVAFSDNSTYIVVGTPTINNTRFVEVNFTVSVNMHSFGFTNETMTAWFAPSGNVTEFVQGSTTYSGEMASQEGNSLVLTFTSLVSIGNAFAGNLPSNSFIEVNHTTLSFGESQINVTDYAISQNYIQYVETNCPSANVSSLELAWQSGVVGKINLVTHFNFYTATSATSTFGITEQLVSLTKAG